MVLPGRAVRKRVAAPSRRSDQGVYIRPLCEAAEDTFGFYVIFVAIAGNTACIKNQLPVPLASSPLGRQASVRASLWRVYATGPQKITDVQNKLRCGDSHWPQRDLPRVPACE